MAKPYRRTTVVDGAIWNPSVGVIVAEDGSSIDLHDLLPGELVNFDGVPIFGHFDIHVMFTPNEKLCLDQLRRFEEQLADLEEIVKMKPEDPANPAIVATIRAQQRIPVLQQSIYMLSSYLKGLEDHGDDDA